MDMDRQTRRALASLNRLVNDATERAHAKRSTGNSVVSDGQAADIAIEPVARRRSQSPSAKPIKRSHRRCVPLISSAPVGGNDSGAMSDGVVISD
jgi:hypothetical protein